MEEKERNGILIVIAFFELRRMNFSKTWIELIIWGTISKRACYKWRVSNNISKHRNRRGKWVATLFKNFFVSWYLLKHSHSCFVYFHWWPDIGWNTPTGDSCFTFHFFLISDEKLLHLFGISPLRVTRDSAIRFWTHAVSARISCVFVKSRRLNIRRNTPTL